MGESPVIGKILQRLQNLMVIIEEMKKPGPTKVLPKRWPNCIRDTLGMSGAFCDAKKFSGTKR